MPRTLAVLVIHSKIWPKDDSDQIFTSLVAVVLEFALLLRTEMQSEIERESDGVRIPLILAIAV